MSKLTPTDGEAGPEAIAGEALAALFEPLTGYDKLYLAVSGGADSMALMHLVADWQAGIGGGGGNAPSITVLSVDHGLRREASGEAEWVMARARERGLAGETLTVESEPPETGIQEWARDQRYNVLCARVLAADGAAALVTGHHQGDVAETVLMRLSRGSGVDGLAAMAVRTVRDGADILRPMLGIAKSQLVMTLTARGATWIEDPSNASDTFERVRLRKLEAERVALGLGDRALARSARRLGRARDALDAVTDAMMEIAIDRPRLERDGLFILPVWLIRELPEDIGVRLLMRALVAVGGAPGRLRLSRLERLYVAVQRPDFSGATLGNAILRPADPAISGRGDGEAALEIYREPDRGRLPAIISTLEEPVVWDHRFIVQRVPAGADAVTVRALERRDVEKVLGGEAAELMPFHEALRSTPVIEEAGGRIFAPALAGEGVAAGNETASDHYQAHFLVERLFSGTYPGSREFSRVLEMVCAMRDKTGSPGRRD